MNNRPVPCLTHATDKRRLALGSFHRNSLWRGVARSRHGGCNARLSVLRNRKRMSRWKSSLVNLNSPTSTVFYWANESPECDPFFTLIFTLIQCVWWEGCICHDKHVQNRGQHLRVHLLLPPCVPQGLHSVLSGLTASIFTCPAFSVAPWFAFLPLLLSLPDPFHFPNYSWTWGLP